MARFCFTFFILALITISGFAQTFVGIKAGANATLAKFESDVYEKFYDVNFKPGFTAGGVFLIENKEKYGLYAEFLYSMKGKSVDSHANNYVSNVAKYHYLDFPILFRMKFNQPKYDWFLQLGPELSYWLGGKGTMRVYDPNRDQITDYDYTLNFGEPINSSDYMNVQDANRLQVGLALGGGMVWKLENGNYVSLDIRYTFGHTYLGEFESGIIPNIGREDNFEHTNQVASISAVYYVDIMEKIRLSKNKFRKR